jgi:hypothetical protein
MENLMIDEESIDYALRQIEQRQARRAGQAKPKKTRRKRVGEVSGNIGAAFARAANEQLELNRLRASGRPYACLDFEGAFSGAPARVSTPGPTDLA